MNAWLARGLVAAIILVLLYGFYVLGWGTKPTLPTGDIRWSIKNEGPHPRTEVAATYYQEKVMVVGGFDQFGRTTATVDLYDPATNSWSQLPDLPQPVHHAMAATIEDVPYLVGGFVGISFTPTERVFRYKGSWEEVASLPSPIGAGAASVVDGLIHVLGGQGPAGNSSAHYIYQVDTNTWQNLVPLPEPRDHLAAATLDGKLYAIGGRLDGNFSKNLARVDVYDPVTDSWLTRPSLVKARSGHAAATIDSQIFVLGGEEPSGTIGTVEAFDALKNRWESVTRLPTPRHGLGAVVVGGFLYTVSGGKRPGLSVSATIEKMEGLP